MAKSEAPKEAPGTAVASWQEELAKQTVAIAQVEKPTGNWISFKGGVMSMNATPFKDNKVKVVVLHSIFENQLYDGPYNPNNQQPPICYAFGEDDKSLKPHPDSAKPQNPDCETCRHNEWGSDPGGGKGKACKNVRRLALISADDLEKVEKAEVALAKLPVMSVKNWSTFASQIANVLKLPPIAVIAEMSEVPDAKSQFQIHFQLIDTIKDGELIQKLLNRRRDINALVYAPYDKPTEAKPAEQRKF